MAVVDISPNGALTRSRGRPRFSVASRLDDAIESAHLLPLPRVGERSLRQRETMISP